MKKATLLLCLFVILDASGAELSGLIVYGVDTINTKNQYGFDFVTQQSCSVALIQAPFSCVNHFTNIFDPSTNKYIFAPDNQDGPAYCITVGKMNLDSIKSAPSDSIFFLQPNGHGDDIPVDSLSSRIGRVYLIKTAPDPRDHYPYYAKLRIIKFIVVDSAQHQIKMVFLWAANITGYHDLTTSALDTFHLDTVPTLARAPGLSLSRISHPANPQYVFKVVGERFIIPQELVGKVKSLTVYDLKGKELGELVASGERNVDLKRIAKNNEVAIIRIARW